MKKASIIVYSGFGHTLYAAHKIEQGLSASGIETFFYDLSKGPVDLESIQNSDAIILGTPTYMGGVSSVMKKFMEDTSRLWFERKWKNKLSGGFTVSSSPSGDKLATLQSLSLFALQHGMIWVGYDRLPENNLGIENSLAKNSLGSYLGLMLQASAEAPEKAFSPGDLDSAYDFGQRLGEVIRRFSLM